MENFNNLIIEPNLILSSFKEGDKPLLCQYLNDAELCRNTLMVPNPYTDVDAANWLDLTFKELEEHGHPINWAIRGENDELIGGIGCFLAGGKNYHADEIGYWLAKPLRGKGIMSKVVRSYCNYLFESRPDLARIEAKVFPFNPASVRLLEKIGFEREGYAKKLKQKKGEYLDCVLLACFRDTLLLN